MRNHYGGLYKSVIGDIGIMIYKDKIINIELFNEETQHSLHSIEMYKLLEENHISKQAIKALTLYLSGSIPLNMKSNSIFLLSIPLYMQGTSFQKDVWNTLMYIPHGETRSYKDIANILGKPNAMRAVGNACKKNPILFFIPCHRVVSHNGKIGGYRAGLDTKKHLLTLEAQTKHRF
ncbi:methylated-DNA--[protein]-cysteine S-methyltransferase [Helicobacter trogontum]|uniref:methylated-DNA--[protein]-cysteine S-methyltransferase n=1 Tax=Helicobacter trogontum TaxID=50960 RepID=A0A4U8TJD9_9HELI|nr:methylated-DNA--[protein]-cysteine S-methyltransferase [Helicobacter trogontum]MDY5186302.1 methylated-DNA--[protein]-cysteine S-methyltransferase [Helicobacter trogontum]TLD99668.1 methylated-DNA--[protein]-cysteine S-methyltransferase [Helicobacter trogontum]